MRLYSATIFLLSLALSHALVIPTVQQCSIIANPAKINCAFNIETVTEESCQELGCCYQTTPDNLNTPRCFYPPNHRPYQVIEGSLKTESNGVAGEVSLRSTHKVPFPGQSDELRLAIFRLNDDVAYVKVYDPNNTRYQPDVPINREIIKDQGRPGNYDYKIADEDNIVEITRGGETVFNIEWNSLIFTEQLLQATTTSLNGSNVNIYGIGERRGPLQLGKSHETFTLWNTDISPAENTSLYGSHPFYLARFSKEVSAGVFLWNTNMLEIAINPFQTRTLTFRPLGGIFEFFVITGTNPNNVIKSFHNLVGQPYLPPLWTLGFQLCKWGYNTIETLNATLRRNQAIGIPVDVQWSDIDYMDRYNDFTVDNKSFHNLRQFVDEIHSEGVRYVPILDPGVSASEPAGTYSPFDDGKKDGIMVTLNGEILVGRVWNLVSTAFPDYSNPKVYPYWKNQLQSLYDQIPFDGIWLDMNEPSNLMNGSRNGCPDSALENPKYLPRMVYDHIYDKTMCMSAQQSAGLHYDVHNLFSTYEIQKSYRALTEIVPNKRPFILTRSSYSGLGQYAAHWEGDNFARWHDLKRSVSAILTSSILGLHLTGSDICGFNEEAEEEMCARWLQLGAFYPFSRSHSTNETKPHDPAIMGDLVQKAAKTSILTRYSLISYLYTSMYWTHATQTTFATPLFLEFDDEAAVGIDEQFLLGKSLMVIPALEKGALNVTAYVPKSRWYDFHSRELIESSGEYMVFDAPFDKVNLLIRGGSIISVQDPESTTAKTMKNPIDLVVALDESGAAEGYVYMDDGETFDYQSGVNFLAQLTAGDKVMSVKTIRNEFPAPTIRNVLILGEKNVVSQVMVHGVASMHAVSVKDQVVQIALNRAFEDFTLSWM